VFVCAVQLAACAHRGGPPPEDATRDPEFQAALREARPEFPTQREALEAGLYETFLPPESLPPPVAGGRAAPAGPGAADALAGARDPAARSPDPTTEELLATLPQGGGPGDAPRRVDGAAARPGRVEEARPAPAAPAADGEYTLQLGAFSAGPAAWARADRARSLVPGAPVEVVEAGGLHRVYLGAFRFREEAEAEARRLAPLGLGEAWVTRRPAR
jgi:cell division protein FtsN